MRNEKSKTPFLVMEKESKACFLSAPPLSSVYFNLQVFDPDMSDLDPGKENVHIDRTGFRRCVN